LLYANYDLGVNFLTFKPIICCRLLLGGGVPDVDGGVDGVFGFVGGVDCVGQFALASITDPSGVEVYAYHCNRCNYTWLPGDFDRLFYIGGKFGHREQNYWGEDLLHRDPPKSCARCGYFPTWSCSSEIKVISGIITLTLILLSLRFNGILAGACC
jgi:hypothetical protein